MKNIFTKIWVLSGILLLSISLLAISAVAQDASYVEIDATVEDGCTWDGAAYASNLRVYDNDICVLRGVHDVGAYNVQVDHDSDGGQLGGWLIIGSATAAETTDITFGGNLIMNGILEIGQSGNPSNDSNLQIDGTSVISGTQSNGNLDIVANTNGANTIDLNGTLTIGTSSTTGIFTNNDDATTSTIYSISNYGTVENLDGTITLDNQIDMYSYGSIDNDGTLTLGSATSYWNNYASTDNSGTFNSPGTINLYSGTTITNSGTWTGGTLYYSGNSATSTNTGTLNLTTLTFIASGTFNNNGTGDINVTGNIVLNSGGTINNNDSGTVTVDTITYVYNTASDINNNNLWETDDLRLGSTTVSGGNFNNYGTLDFPSPAAYGARIYRDGVLANQSAGLITLSTSLLIQGAGLTDVATLTNTNTTDADAINITGQIDMSTYSLIDNSGNLTVSGTNNIDILTNGADIVNNSSGYIDLNGTSQEFNYDVAVDNDGNIAGPGSPVYFSDTASMDNGSGASFTNSGGGGGTIIIQDSAYITNSGGTISLSNLLNILDDGYYNQSSGSISGVNLYLDDATPVTPYFTMSGGTADFSTETKVYEASYAIVNGGSFSTGYLRVGEDGSQQGGVFNITGTGEVALDGGTENQVYRGALNISSSAATPLAMTSSGSNLRIRGIAGDLGTVTHAGSGEVESYIVYIYEGGQLNINDGVWDNTGISGNNMYVYSDNTTHGELNIASGAELHGVTYLYIGYSTTPGGTVTNNGTISRTALPTTSTTHVYFNNGGLFDNYGTVDLYQGGCYMVNETGTRDSHLINRDGGNMTIYRLQTYHEDQIIDNYGYLKIGYDGYLGYSGQGGTFNNGDFAGTDPGELNVLNRFYVQYGGQFNNNKDSIVSGYTRGDLYFDTNYSALKFDSQTSNFPTFGTLTGAVSGAYGTIVGIDDDGAYGTIFLDNITNGPFQDGEALTGAWGNGNAVGSEITPAAFSVGDTITGQYYGSTATVESYNYNGEGGDDDYLGLSNITGYFANNEAILGTSQGAALSTQFLSTDTMAAFTVTGSGTNGDSTLNQYEGTDAPSQAPKLITDSLVVNTNGVVNNYDYIKVGNLNMAGTGGTYNGLLGTGGAGDTQDSKIEMSSGSSYMNGDMLIEGTADDYAAIEPYNTFYIYRYGIVDLYGQLLAHSSTARLSVGGTFYSYDDSYIYFDTDSIGIEMHNNAGSPFVELGGTVDAYKIQATSASSNLDGGYMCLGDYSGTYPAGSCVDSGNTITISNLFYAQNETGTGTTTVDIAVDLDLTTDLSVASGTSTWSTEVNQLSSSTITLTNNSGLDVQHPNSTFNSNGPLVIDGNGTTTDSDYIYIYGGTVNLNYTIAPYDIAGVKLQAPSLGTGDSVLNLASGAVLNLDDIEDCSAGNCAIMIHDYTGASANEAIFNVDGTVNTVAGTTQAIQLGYNDSTYATGELNIGATGTVNLDNTTGGLVVVDDSGRLVIANGGVLSSDSPMDVDGQYNDGTGNRGAYIDGTATVDTSLDIEATGTMDVGSNGTVTVSGSTTSVYGDVELDGTLNPGDLTVYSGGVISSGDGNHLTTGSGCGVGGNFGCGTSTNFFIDATSVDVQSGGLIASDGVSNYQLGGAAATAEGGTYAGEGVSNANSTYGDTKAGGSTADHANAEGYSPVYGDSGDWSGSYSPGGGGVYIRSTGDITINGEVRANGADNNNASEATGSGGTVIIEQDIDHTDTTNVFTGSGYIRANGGDSSGSNNEVGAGGRIIIESIILDDPDDGLGEYDFDNTHVEALGGVNLTDAEYAAAGTIVYLGDDNNPNGTMIVDQQDNGPSAGLNTQIWNAVEIFDRIEARNGADITYVSDPLAPTVCYTTGTGSSITFNVISCDDYDEVPDKPDTFFINDTVEGAQTRAETPSDGEPKHDNQTTGIYDFTPVLTFILRSPELTTYDYQKLEIQVDDTDETFTSLIWDATGINAIDLGAGNVINHGQRNIDVEYAGGALTSGTPYFIRARFVDADGDEGLWTHMDMGSYYQFDLDGELTITDGCGGSIDLKQDGLGVDNPSTNSGDRYAAESCTFTITSTEAAFRLLFGLDPASSGFTNGGAEDIDEIDNEGTADCSIDTDGEGSEEEWGYNISSAAALITNNVNSNGNCSADYDDWTDTGGVGQYLFDVEPDGSEDEIVTVGSGGVTAGTDFDVNLHATINSSTAPDDYSADVRAIITGNP